MVATKDLRDKTLVVFVVVSYTVNVFPRICC